MMRGVFVIYTHKKIIRNQFESKQIIKKNWIFKQSPNVNMFNHLDPTL